MPAEPVVTISTVSVDVWLRPAALSSILLRIMPIWVDVTHTAGLNWAIRSRVRWLAGWIHPAGTDIADRRLAVYFAALYHDET